MKKEKTNKVMQIYQHVAARLRMASMLGMQHEGNRDLYSVFGYKGKLMFSDYYKQYKRQDIAEAIINRPIKATWRGSIKVLESTEADNTSLEQAWDTLLEDQELKVKKQFIKVDRFTGLGRYGILLLGLSDVKVNNDVQKPVTSKSLKLLYLKAYNEGSIEIKDFEQGIGNPRYGLPLFYRIKTIKPGTANEEQEIKVHHSRIIHIVEDSENNEYEGTPRLRSVFNRLQDIEKLVGGSAEMFWRSASPGYQAKIDEDYELNPEIEEEMKGQITEYEHGLRRFLVNKGMSWDSLAQQIADPKSHVEVQMEMISAKTGIPKRMLTGSEKGELASTQDNDQWLTLVAGRRDEFATSEVLKPFIDRLIKYGVLPSAGKEGYSVQWEDLFSPSEKERAEVGRIRATALKEYHSQAAAETTVPPEAFFRFFLGLNEDEIELIKELRDQEYLEDQDNEGNEDNDEDNEGNELPLTTFS